MQPKIVELVVSWEDIRVIRKVRQTQHQNPEFGHTQGEIFKKPAKKYISIQGREGVKTINFGGKLGFILSFLFPERLHCCYIYFHSTCTTTIISLETCALNAEFEHFVLKFNQMSFLCGYHWERGWGVKGGPKTGWRQGYFTHNSIIKKSFKEVSNIYNFDIWNSQVLCRRYVRLYKEIWS